MHPTKVCCQRKRYVVNGNIDTGRWWSCGGKQTCNKTMHQKAFGKNALGDEINNLPHTMFRVLMFYISK